MKLIAQADFQLPPEDLLTAVLTAIVDTGVEADPFNVGETRHQLCMKWAIDLPDGDATEQWAWVSFSMHPKSKLYKATRALLGGVDPKGEIELDDLIGCRARVQIEHYQSKGKTRSKIVGYFPAAALATKSGHGVTTVDEDFPGNLQ